MNIQEKNQKVSLKGIYKITKAKLETAEQWALHNKIVDFIKQGKDVMDMVRKLNSICKVEILEFENIIPTVGRTLLANNLTTNSPTNDPYINYTALGTGSTAVANSDTQLATESYRKATASATNSSNVGYVAAFYTASECNGTYKEAGLFCNASGTVNSGVLFSRVLLNAPTGIVKSITETLTIDYTITIS